MAEKSSSKSIEYVENDFSSLNTHVEGILYNEKQISRLKKYRVDRVRIKQFGLIVLILGILAILLAIAYHFIKKPVSPEVHTIVKTEYIDKPIIKEIEVPKIVEVPVYYAQPVPDPNHPPVYVEVPVYIDRPIKVPIQVGAEVTEEFTFFNTEVVNDLNGIFAVVRGASYKSVQSPYPYKQYCYTLGSKNPENQVRRRLTLSNKKSTNSPINVDITEEDAKEFGATKNDLKKAVKYCKWHPDSPPIEDVIDPKSPIASNPIELAPDMPPGTYGYGTGFYINNNGYLVTNQHVIDTKDNNVIDQCSSVWVKDGKSKIKAKVIEQDINLDIALLKINKVTSNYAIFGGVRTAEDVTALGFPEADILGSDLKATNGNVSSIADKNFLQYTAPTNSGNSGGPLLNNKGLVVGVVRATAIDLQVTNLGIKGTSVQNFLGRHNINFEYDDSDVLLEKGDIFDIGKKFTVMVICYP
jgi:S1-C subfamily serine protease